MAKTKKDLDLVDLHEINPRIVIDMRFASANNFLGRPLYSSPKCFLRRKVAEKLDRIQKQIQRAGLGLKVFDAYRPKSVQKVLWEKLPDSHFFTAPETGAQENRGAAIAVTLVGQGGGELRMPSDFCSFTQKSLRSTENLPKEVICNRLLLENIMRANGFIPYADAWWLFADADWVNYPVEDIPFEELSL